MAPVRAADAAARVSRRPASGGHSASRSSPCGRVAGRWSAQPATIADRITRTPASRGGNQSGSWLRPDGRSGWTSWRPPSTARSRPWSGTRGCELRNLQWLVPIGRPCGFPRYFARVRRQLANRYFLSSVNRSSWHPWPTLARSEATRAALAGGQLRALNRLRAEVLATLPLGIDTGEIDGPVWSVSDRGTAGAVDRVAQIPARPFRLGLTRVL